MPWHAIRKNEATHILLATILGWTAGAVLTKMDGDSRGGAALSVKAVSGKPIKFVGTGEKLESLEVFYPDRIASRILGAHRSLCPKLALQQR